MPMILLTLLCVKKFARKMNLILLVNDFDFRWVLCGVKTKCLKLNFIEKGKITCKIIVSSSVCVSVVTSAVTDVVVVVSPTDVTSSSPVVVVGLVWITVKVTVAFLQSTFR